MQAFQNIVKENRNPQIWIEMAAPIPFAVKSRKSTVKFISLSY